MRPSKPLLYFTDSSSCSSLTCTLVKQGSHFALHGLPQLALSSTEQLYHVHLVSHYLSVAQSHLFLARAPYKGEELIQMALDLPLCQGEVGISKAHILRVPPITERRHVAGTWGCLVTSGSIRKQRPDKGRAQVGNWTPSKPCTTDATVQRFNNFPKQCQQRGPKRSDTRTSRGRLTCQLLASRLNHSHHCLNYVWPPRLTPPQYFINTSSTLCSLVPILHFAFFCLL